MAAVCNSISLFMSALIELFNACFERGQYQSTWSDDILTTIHKSENASDTYNYRGITITSVVDILLFNSIINSRLDSYSEKKNLGNARLVFANKPEHQTIFHSQNNNWL